jgi:hypothetical protein
VLLVCTKIAESSLGSGAGHGLVNHQCLWIVMSVRHLLEHRSTFVSVSSGPRSASWTSETAPPEAGRARPGAVRE